MNEEVNYRPHGTASSERLRLLYNNEHLHILSDYHYCISDSELVFWHCFLLSNTHYVSKRKYMWQYIHFYVKYLPLLLENGIEIAELFNLKYFTKRFHKKCKLIQRKVQRLVPFCWYCNFILIHKYVDIESILITSRINIHHIYVLCLWYTNIIFHLIYIQHT